MSMITPPGDDEPPEPVLEDEHCALTLVDGGVRFMLHASALVTKLRIVGSLPKSKTRNVRPWRSHVSVAAARDDRYMLQLLATVWRETISSVKCDLPLHNLQNTVAADPLISSFRALVPEGPVGNSFTYSLASPLLPTFTKFRLPLIIVTPPSDDSCSASLSNGVPTPQDAAFGNKLTVPDPDSAVVNSRGHALYCLEISGVDKYGTNSMYQEEESDSANAAIHEKRSTEPCQIQEVENEDGHPVDLARTWCG